MKQKLLSTAIVAALTGGMGAAQAVYNNPDGLGQVLIYPMYTVEGTNDTLINIVNTSSLTKAVKVRFLEAMNSQEVLDFNLYLSPYDHWSAAVTRDPNGGEAAIVRTNDTSCTVPSVVARGNDGVPFRNLLFTADSVNGLDRTREGYLEVIEMGNLRNEDADDSDAFNPAKWATHVGGTPENCAKLVSAWNTGGAWRANPTRAVTAANGGLYGYGVLINPPQGTAVAYDSLALDDFWADGAFRHTSPGDTSPSLGSAAPRAQVLDGNQIVDTVTAFSNLAPQFWSVNAVSATIMHDSIMNDYVTAPEIAASTDWVINFPTKRFYVNVGPYDDEGNPLLDAAPPFDNHWSQKDSKACEVIDITYWDREEAEERVEDVDFSPAPEGEQLELCKEVNVLTFNEGFALNASDRIAANVDVAFDNGWARINFTGAEFPNRVINGGPGDGFTSDVVFRGLPVIGFAVQQYVNGDLGGLLSNYMGLVNHKATRDIDILVP